MLFSDVEALENRIGDDTEEELIGMEHSSIVALHKKIMLAVQRDQWRRNLSKLWQNLKNY